MARFVTGDIFMEGLDRLLKERVKDLNKKPQITEDAEFEIISSELHDPSKNVSSIFEKFYGKSDEQIKNESYERTMERIKQFPVYVGMDFAKGPDNDCIITNSEA